MLLVLVLHMRFDVLLGPHFLAWRTHGFYHAEALNQVLKQHKHLKHKVFTFHKQVVLVSLVSGPAVYVILFLTDLHCKLMFQSQSRALEHTNTNMVCSQCRIAEHTCVRQCTIPSLVGMYVAWRIICEYCHC